MIWVMRDQNNGSWFSWAGALFLVWALVGLWGRSQFTGIARMPGVLLPNPPVIVATPKNESREPATLEVQGQGGAVNPDHGAPPSVAPTSAAPTTDSQKAGETSQ